MAITTTTIIDDAAELVKVKGHTQALTSSLQTKYLRLLNQMLNSWRNEGVNLGLDTLAQGDTIYVDEADELCIFYNLALMIAQSVGRQISPEVREMAITTLNSLKAKYFTQKELDQSELLLNNINTNILTGA